MESTPYLAFMRGLMKRQPMVVSSSLTTREKDASALFKANGARDMLSTPPAMMKDASPLLMARAAVATASMLEPQRRLTVAPETSLGNPPSRIPIRPTLRLPSPPSLPH